MFWLLVKLTIWAIGAPYVWTFLYLPFVGLMALAVAGERAKPAPWFYLVVPFQALYQAYFWGLYGSWCGVLTLRYIAARRYAGAVDDVPAPLGLWGLGVLLVALVFAVLPPLRLALKEARLSGNDRARRKAWKAFILVGGYSTVGYGVCIFSLPTVKPVYGWALNILHRIFN